MAEYRSFRTEPLVRAIAAVVAAGGSDAREAQLVAAGKLMVEREVIERLATGG